MSEARISDGEMAYHAKLVEQARALSAAQAQHAAVLRSWGAHLTSTYDLAEGEYVDEHGRIVRPTDPKEPTS